MEIKTEITIDGITYIIWIDKDGTAHILISNKNKEVKVLPILRDIIVPYMKTSLNIYIDLWHTGKNNPKNTRTLAKEVIEKHNEYLKK